MRWGLYQEAVSRDGWLPWEADTGGRPEGELASHDADLLLVDAGVGVPRRLPLGRSWTGAGGTTVGHRLHGWWLAVLGFGLSLALALRPSRVVALAIPPQRTTNLELERTRGS